MDKKILILDFGSQYTQLIARRIREENVYSEIHPFNYDLSKENINEIYGIILSGGPSSVKDENAPTVSPKIFDLNIPILGICYGMQLIVSLLGGVVERATTREYGKTILNIKNPKSKILKNIKNKSIVWMSHGDSVVKLPEGFDISAITDSNSICVCENIEKNIYALQFHPEVIHTEEGRGILKNFLFSICGCKRDWSMTNYLEYEIQNLKDNYKDKKIILGVSGGVDSTTLAVLLTKALGNNVRSIFVNNGLLRYNEENEILHNLRDRLKLNVEYIDATDRFLNELKGVENPEEKRRIIGRVFIETFYGSLHDFDYLAQGTLYPDVIESVSVKGPSVTIKTHHNRVKEVAELEKEGRILEPFKFLFKDEVREIAKLLDIPEDIFGRHPFPGPGLAVRIIGEVTKEKLQILKKADHIFINTLKKHNYYDKVWQAFAVYLPVKAVGVMGDERAYGNVIALRSVESVDGMTANFGKIPFEILEEAGNQIIREIKEVTRVVYDITSKPPATIEWE